LITDQSGDAGMSEVYTGVVDRIIGGQTAVIRLPDAPAAGELTVAIEELPPGAHEVDSRLAVTVAQGTFVDAELETDTADGLVGRLRGRLGL
jgi:hypothetical protein